MTLFSIIWFLIILWCFCKSDIKYMLFYTLLFMTFQCDNVITVSFLGVGPQILTSIAFIIKAVQTNRGVLKLRRGRTMLVITALLLFATIVVSCTYNGTLANRLLNILQILTYMLCFFAIMFFCRGVSSKDLYGILRKIIIFLLVLGVAQLLTTMEIIPLRSVLQALFYNDTSDTVYFHHSNYHRIMSSFMEPSYFSGLLVGMFYYFLSMKEKWGENKFLLIAILIELIFTQSSTGYGAFIITGVIFILCHNRIKIQTKILILILAVTGFTVIYIGFFNILDAVIFSKDKSGSWITRTNMNTRALERFQSSQWFGVGYKNVRGSSIVYSLLAETGILGFGAYILFNIVLLVPTFLGGQKEKKVDNNYIGVIFALLGTFVCQLIACPDLDLCTYWFWVYAIGVCRYIYVWQRTQNTYPDTLPVKDMTFSTDSTSQWLV